MSIEIFIQNKKAIPVYDKENQKIGNATIEEDTLIGIVESWEKVDVSNRKRFTTDKSCVPVKWWL